MSNNKWYGFWRKHEAYAVPCTEEGEAVAQQRAEQFKAGFEAGINYAAFSLEEKHRSHGVEHKFYYFASELVRNLLK